MPVLPSASNLYQRRDAGAVSPDREDDLGHLYVASRTDAAEKEALDWLMRETGEAKPTPPAQGADAGLDPPRKSRPRNALTAAAMVLGDIAGGVVETPLQVTGGAIDAVNQIVNLTDDIGDWLNENVADLGGVEITGQGVRLIPPGSGEDVGLRDPLPTTSEADSVTGGMVRSISQFLTGFAAGGAVLKSVGVGAQLTSAGQVAKAAAQGAIADFSAFDPAEARLSDLIESVPQLKNPVTDYLAGSDDDSAFEGRMKNTLEGLGLGVATDVLGRSIKGLKAVRQARKAIKPPAEAAKEEIVDFAARMGNPKGPRVTKAKMKPLSDDTATAFLRGMDGDAEAPFAANINLARLDTTADIDQALRTTADLFSDSIDGARRGTISMEETGRLADDLGMSVDALLSRRKGQAFNAEEALAARRIMASSATQIVDLAKTAKAGGEADLVAFRRALAVHKAIQEQVSGLTAEAGRALNAFKIAAGSEDYVARQLKDVIAATGGEGVTKELADAVARSGTLSEANTIIRNGAKATTWDMVAEARINGLLSNPTTHGVNMLSNAITTLWQVPERLLASGFSSLDGSDAIQSREALHLAYGLAKSTREAFVLAAKALWRGESSDLLDKIDVPHHKAISGTNLGLEGPLGHAADFLGAAIRLPGRALTASDEFFKAWSYRGELHALAYRQAASEGLDGQDLARRIAEIVSDPPESIRLGAVDFARRSTFTNPLGPAGGDLMRLRNRHPAFRVIVPFLRTPINIMGFALRRSPLAPLLGSFQADIAAGGARRDLALAQLSLGSMAMLAAADLTADGIITGGGPSDPELFAAKRNTGWQPYSVKFGDTYYAYNRLDPLGWMIGVGADMAELTGEMSEDDEHSLVVSAVAAVAKNFVSKTYVRSVSEFMEAANEPERYAQGFLIRMAGSFVPYTALLGQIERTTDPTLRDSRVTGKGSKDRELVLSLIADIKSRTPGFSKDLPPRRNIFGEPIQLGGGLGPDLVSPIYMSTDKNDPVADEIWRNRVQLSMPQRKVNGVELTAEEYSRYVELAGNELKVGGKGMKDALADLMSKRVYQTASDGPDGLKSEMIRSVVMNYREAARGQIIREFPDLQFAVEIKARKKAERLTETVTTIPAN